RKSYIYLSIVLLLAAACAKQGAPSGGPKDTTPPEVIKTEPQNGATNFTGKTITISFDEFVTLDKIQEKFMMSPPVIKKPDIAVKGKNIVITIDEELRDSTTYTLYFQDAIRDLNESNILENYQFRFSTGRYIDSLSLAGEVFQAFNLEVPERMLIMLHSNLSDTAPLKLIPDYISMSDQQGYFTINNLHEGRYRLFALEDMNSNRKYEPGDESFAFADAIVEISPMNNYSPLVADSILHVEEADSTHRHAHLREPDYLLYSSASVKTKYYLAATARRQAKLLEYFFSVPLDTMKFTFEAAGLTQDDYFTEITRNRDTIRLWLRDSAVYNQPLIETIITYPFTNTGDSVVYKTDTIPMRFIQPRATRGNIALKGLAMQVNATRTGIPPGRDIMIVPESPLRSADFSLFSITLAGDTTGLTMPFEPEFDTLVPRQIRIKQTLEPGKEYILTMLPGAMTSIYGETNDTASYRFPVRLSSTYGTLNTMLKEYEGSVIVQLLDGRESLIMETQAVSPGKASFSFIENGTYRLKVIYDTDGNGKWTPGDFLKGRQPEMVSYFPKVLEIKSNWDLEEDWDISIPGQKDQGLRTKQPQKR
ncbi:MAG: Ig-like domain-containing protein, partial [Bacteroidales bacterium]|nr:Ig-like domain-containing protein [Bacteroidales bacterium]